MTKTIEVYSAIILEPIKNGKDYTCYIVFNRLEGNEKKFLSEAINIEGLVTSGLNNPKGTSWNKKFPREFKISF